MPGRRRRPVPQFSDSPVTGHLPPPAVLRDSEGRYYVTEGHQPSKRPTQANSQAGRVNGNAERLTVANNGKIHNMAAANGDACLGAETLQKGDEKRQMGTEMPSDTIPEHGPTAAKTATATGLEDIDGRQRPSDGGASSANNSASSGGSARRLVLVLSSPESSPEVPGPATVPKRHNAAGGSTAAARPKPGLPPEFGSTSLPAFSGTPSLVPSEFDSDEDDIFECELRSRIGDVITLLRGDTDLSANGNGGERGRGGEGVGGGSGGGLLEGSGDSTGDGDVESGIGAGAGLSSRGPAQDHARDEELGSRRVPDFAHPASVAPGTGGPPCRLPAAHVTADNSLAARARHVVGRRPGERVVSELAELARSPGSPLLRRSGPPRTGRTVTPRGRRGGGTPLGRGGVTPIGRGRATASTVPPSPLTRTVNARTPLTEKQSNGFGDGSPVLGRTDNATGKRERVGSPDPSVVRARSDPDASGDGTSSGATAATSPKSRSLKTGVSEPEVITTLPHVKPPTKRLFSDRENQIPSAVRTSPRLASRLPQRHLSVPATGVTSPSAAGDTARHLSVPGAGVSSPAAAREQDEEDEIACTQPVTGLVLDGVVAIVDVRSGADNRSEPVRAQLRALGALVVDRFNKQVTHVVFKDGSKATFDRARRARLRLVSALWVDACRQQRERVDENLFPPPAADRYESPMFPARLRKLRSMQPRDFEEELAAAERRFRRRRRQQRTDGAGAARQRPAMTSPKSRCGRRTVEQLLTPHGQRTAAATGTVGGASSDEEDDLPLGTRLFNRFMSPAGVWSTGGAVRRAASPTAKLAAQVSASPVLETNQRRANRTGSSHASGSGQSSVERKTAAKTTSSSSADQRVSSDPTTSAAAAGQNLSSKPATRSSSGSKRSLSLPSDSDSDSDAGSDGGGGRAAGATVGARAGAARSAPAGRRRRRRLMTPPESQSLLKGPLLQPVTPAAPLTASRRRPAVAHPALRPPSNRCPSTSATTAANAGATTAANATTNTAAGATGERLSRLRPPRRSSLDFEAAPRRAPPPPPPPRARMVLTNLRSVERETLMPVIEKLGGVAVVEEVSSNTTHVISGQPRRTASVLGALAIGAWLLSPEWPLASLEAGHWLREDRFEQASEWPAARARRKARAPPSLAPPVRVDESGLTESTFGVTGAGATAAAGEGNIDSEGEGERKERNTAADNAGLLSTAGAVFISGDTCPPPQVLTRLVKLAGGTVAPSARAATLAVGRLCRGVETVTELWLMDSLQMNRLLPRQRYLQRSPAAAGKT